MPDQVAIDKNSITKPFSNLKEKFLITLNLIITKTGARNIKSLLDIKMMYRKRVNRITLNTRGLLPIELDAPPTRLAL